MDNADRQSTITSIDQQYGQPNASSDEVSNFERLAADYCSNPYVNDDTIGGMLDSRAP
jgi:hypothetical protein